MNPDDNKMMMSGDHDLIVEIKTELKLFREESRATNGDTKERLIKLGENKLDKDAFVTFLENDGKFKADHERRMRAVERWLLLGLGGLYVITVIIGWYLIFKHG